MDLHSMGWDAFFEAHFAPFREQDMLPARVIRQDRTGYVLLSETDRLSAKVAGKLFLGGSKGLLPTVGDWVAMENRPGENTTIIRELLPRKTKFSRKAAGEISDEQVVAANVDTVFLVSGLDKEFNIRRMERYLTLGWDSGARPVIVLNKADLCEDVSAKLRQVETIAPGVDIYIVSAIEGKNVDNLRKYLSEGKTCTFLGSSGVGKSTLVNRLLGEERMKTGEIRTDDSRGRHVTSHKELVFSPGGGMIIDTPGMREVQLLGTDENLQGAFQDIEELAAGCRFRNCSHQSEPGCTVREALEKGELDKNRYLSYLKLKRELGRTTLQKSDAGKRLERARDKATGKLYKRIIKDKKSKRL